MENVREYITYKFQIKLKERKADEIKGWFQFKN